MKPKASLPPAPLNATCPLWMLCEWAEIFRNGLASRSKILLEIAAADGPAPAGERWLALVTWDLRSSHLRSALPSALRREYGQADFNAGLDRRTSGEIFAAMRASGESVRFIALHAWGGAAIFIRKPHGDISLNALLGFNREGRRSRIFRHPRPRLYPQTSRNGETSPGRGSESITSTA